MWMHTLRKPFAPRQLNAEVEGKNARCLEALS